MSSALNHVPGFSRVSSQRTVKLLGRCYWPTVLSISRRDTVYWHILQGRYLHDPVSGILNLRFSSRRDSHQFTHYLPERYTVPDADPPQCDVVDSKSHQNAAAKDFLLYEWWHRVRMDSHLNQYYQSTKLSSQSIQSLGDENCPRHSLVELTRRPSGLEYKNARRINPSDYLLNALRSTGRSLGKIEPQTQMARRSRRMQHKFIPLHVARKRRPSRRCLQTILAEYIQFVEPLLDRANETEAASNHDIKSDLDSTMKEVFCEEHLQYLEVRRYSIKDVVAWAWILRSDTTYQAALRVLALEEELQKKYGVDSQGVPPFIPLFLLRKEKRLEANAFRLLLTYCLPLISGRPSPTPPRPATGNLDDLVERTSKAKSTKVSIDSNMCVSLTESLLYHGRQVWPQAQLDIARAFALYLARIDSESTTLRGDRFRVESANKLLKVLSIPSNASPFVSASIQQQAQFEILKAMAGRKPALPVTRRGYRGIITVQLAHRKTQAERQSAKLKAVTWPPWREDKLGIDSQRGTEGMQSRAMQVINQMKHAGYSNTCWEDTAAVLAGWDTDKSPTVQTRGIMHRVPHSQLLHTGKSGHAAIWLARIRATRTVREAWACFLSYRSLKHPPCWAVYAAMAEKLIYRGKAIKNDFEHISLALPGDGPEVFSEPSSARDVIYVDIKPPTLDEFLKQMLSEGIRPSGRFLALLLQSAPTLDRGLDYLSCSDLPDRQVKALGIIRGGQEDIEEPDRSILDEIPDNIFSAFIEFLCKFSQLDTYISRSDVHMADAFPIIMGARKNTQTTTLFTYSNRVGMEDMLDYPKILSHTIRLVRSRNSRSPQPWVHLLSGLSKYRISTRQSGMKSDMQLVLAWYEVIEATGWMRERGVEIGLRGFQILCQNFTRVAAAAVNDSDDTEKALSLVDAAIRRRDLVHCRYAGWTPGDLVQSGLRLLKGHFDDLVLLDPVILKLIETRSDISDVADSRVTVPSMPSVPTPAILHAFTRALGAADDTDGLLSLLRWIGQNALALEKCADELLGGRRMMRRTTVAMRVFLERPWEEDFRELSDTEDLTGEGPSFADPNLQEAYDIVDKSPFLGPWPSDREVQEYVNWER